MLCGGVVDCMLLQSGEAHKLQLTVVYTYRIYRLLYHMRYILIATS